MSQTADFNSEDRSVPPACRQSTVLLQRVCDNELPASSLDTDSHLAVCSVCRERIAAAKHVLAALSSPIDATTPQPNLTDKIVAAVLGNFEITCQTRLRRRVYTLSGGLAIAAGLLLAVWYVWVRDGNRSAHESETVKAPAPRTEPIANSEPETTPVQRPVRLGDEFYKAEQALLGSSKPITEPVAVAPQVLAKLTDALTRPSGHVPEPEAAGFSLLEIPDAARSGFQPVASTTQKAFARLLHDVGAVQISAKPN
jgi:hypothetical protein